MRSVGWAGPISDDTLGLALAACDWESVRATLHRLGKRMLKRWAAGRYLDSSFARRLKPLGLHRAASQALVAIDGHTLFSSKSPRRCCDHCHQSRIPDDKGGFTTYYTHQVLVAQWIGARPALVLDFEPVYPGENELVAAKRLVPRLKEAYGQAIGMIIYDAMADNMPYRRMVRDCGYTPVTLHWDFAKEPVKTATRLQDKRDPDRKRPDWRYKTGASRYEVWEQAAPGVRRIEVRRMSKEHPRVWRCVTDAESGHIHALALAFASEERWEIENKGFHELVRAWHLDRAFVHAGKPTAVWAIVALALLAYSVFEAFAFRNLKLNPERPARSLDAIRRDLAGTLVLFGLKGQARARAP